jgi:hypothetical protein
MWGKGIGVEPHDVQNRQNWRLGIASRVYSYVKMSIIIVMKKNKPSKHAENVCENQLE